MNLKKLHDPAEGVLKAVALMSGSGTNLCRVLEHEKRLEKELGASPFTVTAIFTDNADSKALAIGREYNLPVLVRDIRAYYSALGLPRKDMGARSRYDEETVRMLAPFRAKLAIYAGYMSIASDVLIKAFFGVNVHPADLSVTEGGRRKWVGGHSVRDAIAAGEKTIASTTHIVEPEVDGGRILMISTPVPVEIPAGADLSDRRILDSVTNKNQDTLKEQGDWIIMPRTIEYIASGRYAVDEERNLYFDGQPVPRGVRL